jgi:hypothetical protein
VTPAIASEWMKHVLPGNRVVRDPEVAKTIHRLRLGSIHPDAGMIQLDWSEPARVINGQHRLTAIIRTGIPALLMVQFGVDPAVYSAIDTGKRKTPADFLRVSGEARARQLAAAARVCVAWERGELARAHNIVLDPTDILDWVVEHPSIRDVILDGRRVSSHLRLPESVCTAFAYRAALAAPSSWPVFRERCCTIVGLTDDDPVTALLRWSENMKRRKIGGAHLTQTHAAILVKAWNAYMVAEPVRMLRWLPSGVRREPFPDMLTDDDLS